MAEWSLTGTSPETASGEDALSVSQAVDMAAGALGSLPRIVVIGEVTGFRGPNARSGHCYFQIKDESAALDVVVWNGVYKKRLFDLRDGLKVQFTGVFDVYKPTGKMSFKASSFTLAGEGLLRQQVAMLAEKLRLEGLMEPARKRRIPAFCTRVAVVTSLSGAVINDVKRTLRRRNPLVELVCVGSKVQGDGAPAELIDGLRRASSLVPAPDCILLVRGGGSFEDLMTFNDEELARAVASCPVPVVTGIGHEPDTSICDMVSDRRCSTPTAAAESVAPEFSELVAALDQREQRLQNVLVAQVGGATSEVSVKADRIQRAMGSLLDRLQLALAGAASRPCLTDPTNIIDHRRMELAQTSDRFMTACDRMQERYVTDLERMVPRLMGSTSGLVRHRHELTLAASRLHGRGDKILAEPRAALARDAAALDALSPLKVLARGYAIAYDGEGKVATSAESFAEGDTLHVRMADGDVVGTVASVSVHA